MNIVVWNVCIHDTLSTPALHIPNTSQLSTGVMPLSTTVDCCIYCVHCPGSVSMCKDCIVQYFCISRQLIGDSTLHFISTSQAIWYDSPNNIIHHNIGLILFWGWCRRRLLYRHIWYEYMIHFIVLCFLFLFLMAVYHRKRTNSW